MLACWQGLFGLARSYLTCLLDKEPFHHLERTPNILAGCIASLMDGSGALYHRLLMSDGIDGDSATFLHKYLSW